MNRNLIVDQYLDGLKKHLSEDDVTSLSYASGASPMLLVQLKVRYPYCPESLIELLSMINGTYWQKYGEHTIAVLILGSDVTEYPYYLKSVEQILEENNQGASINEIYKEYRLNFPDLVDSAIDPDINLDKWLCFSDCMNNGGTSSIYVDFNPSSFGRKGQIVRFLHDPDSFKVIANSFDDYLQMLIDGDYSFVVAENQNVPSLSELAADNKFELVLDFTKKNWMLDNEILTRKTRLQKDLGIEGDDADEFIFEFSTTFKISIEHLDLSCFFRDNGTLTLILNRILKRPERYIRDLTLGDLEIALIKGSLDNETLLGTSFKR